jgi:hypothetical protein
MLMRNLRVVSERVSFYLQAVLEALKSFSEVHRKVCEDIGGRNYCNCLFIVCKVSVMTLVSISTLLKY